MNHICRYGWNWTIDDHFIRMGFYHWITYRIVRVERVELSASCLQCRLLTPRIHPNIFFLRRAEYSKSIPYGTSRLAVEDNTLIVLLSILCPQEDLNPYLWCRKSKFYPLNYGNNLMSFHQSSLLFGKGGTSLWSGQVSNLYDWKDQFYSVLRDGQHI